MSFGPQCSDKAISILVPGSFPRFEENEIVSV